MSENTPEVKYIKLYTYATGLLGDSLEFEGTVGFDVTPEWAEKQAIQAGWESLEDFQDEYTYDDTEEWPKDAQLQGQLFGFEIQG